MSARWRPDVASLVVPARPSAAGPELPHAIAPRPSASAGTAICRRRDRLILLRVREGTVVSRKSTDESRPATNPPVPTSSLRDDDLGHSHRDAPPPALAPAWPAAARRCPR